jgi:hypothetical protein
MALIGVVTAAITSSNRFPHHQTKIQGFHARLPAQLAASPVHSVNPERRRAACEYACSYHLYLWHIASAIR